MEKEEFVKALFEKKKGQASDMLKFLLNVPGRKPHQKHLEMSAFCQSLNEEGRQKLQMIIDESIDDTLFGFLCILDHVSFLEDVGEKSTFELYAVKDGVRTLINDPNKEELHNLYNDYALPQE